MTMHLRKLNMPFFVKGGQPDSAKCHILRSSNKGNEQNDLHSAIRLVRPARTILKIIHACPVAVKQLDKDAKTALHVAAEYGASSKVIDHLIAIDSSAACRRDKEGKTPTHAQSPFAAGGGTSCADNDASAAAAAAAAAAAVCASASADGTVKLWKLTSEMLEGGVAVGTGTEALLAEEQAAEDAAESSTTTTNTCNLPKPGPIGALRTLHGHTRGINDVAWSPTAEYLATASDDKSLRIWDAETGAALVELRGHTNYVFSCAFSPQTNLLVSGSFDETVKLWDVRSGDCVSTLPAHSDPVTDVDFNRDGTCVVSGSHDGLIRIWDTMTGECLKTIYAGGNPPVSYVRFSPNGKFVLSGTLDSTLRLWRAGDRDGAVDDAAAAPVGGGSALGGGGARCTKTYVGGHRNSKFCIFSAFAVADPRRQSIVTGSEDGGVYVYDLQRRDVRQVLRAHKDAVLAVAAHDTRDLLASGGMTEDKTVRFWVPGASSYR